MSKSNNVQLDLIQHSNEADEFQNSKIREFVEEKAGDSRKKGPVDESTARLPDEQNRLIEQHHSRRGE